MLVFVSFILVVFRVFQERRERMKRVERPISFSMETGWQLIDGLVMDYYILDQGQLSFKYTSIQESDSRRKVGDILIFKHKDGLNGKQYVFFNDYPAIKTWGWGDGTLKQVQVGLDNRWWQLSEEEDFTYRDLNDDQTIPPPGIMIYVFNTQTDKKIMRIVMTPTSGEIMESDLDLENFMKTATFRKGILCRYCRTETKEIFIKPGIVECVHCHENKFKLGAK